ncbi:hypothetical protein Taro_030476 [Colocasia esculenta]|uniref:Uncharacterized protein n=1 Tax=Colocasia esculenta TaxID=4460 RepID=A0A843VPA0_COLES|nr:hypothetical protein [Colocasia esculenta]
MASSTYDWRYYSTGGSSQRQEGETPPAALHLYVFLLVLVLFLGLSCYLSWESLLQGLLDQLRPAAALTPLALLLAVLWRLPLTDQLFHERGSLHRAGGSPWGLGLAVVFLAAMVFHQSALRERWFPLLGR